MNTNSNALKTGLELAVKALAETHTIVRPHALSLLTKLQNQSITSNDAISEVKKLSSIVTAQKDKDNAELQSSLEELGQTVALLKKNKNTTNSQQEKLEGLSIIGLSTSELIKSLTRAFNDFAHEALKLRASSHSVADKYQDGQNIILGDINWSSKQMINALAPLLLRLKLEHRDDTKISEITKKVELESKKKQINFFDAVNLVEEGLRNLTRVHGKKNIAEAEYLKTFQSHLKGMHSFLNQAITENNTFLAGSNAEKEALDKIITGFKEASEKESDPDRLRALINDNVNHMNGSIKKLLSRQDRHIRQQQRTLDSYRSEIRNNKAKTEALLRENIELENAIKDIEKLSLVDKLTGIGNRRAYDNYLDSLSQNNESFGLIVLDIDHFKSINDNYGHKLGDAVLKRFALHSKTFISQMSKEKDIDIFRYGGEEFVIVFKETGIKEALLFSERMRHRLTQAIFKHEEKSIKITVSIGVSRKEKNEQHKDTFERADKAMYHSKQEGRNQVSFFHNNIIKTLKKSAA